MLSASSSANIANAYPPNVDVLVEQRFLRKKFKDPVTGDDFALLPAGAGATAPGQQADPGGPAPAAGRGSPSQGTTVSRQPSQQPPQAGGGGQRGAAGGAGSARRSGRRGSAGAGALRGVSPIGTPGAGGGTTAGVGGVASKSKDQSIRLYNGRNHYNEWAFVYQPQVQQAGQGGAPGTAQPGQISQPPGPGGRGRGGLETLPGGRAAAAAATRSTCPAAADVARASRRRSSRRTLAGVAADGEMVARRISDHADQAIATPQLCMLGRRLLRDGFPAATR